MEFESSIEPFDELLEGSVGFRFFVEVLQADDRVMFNAGQFLRTFFVHEVNAGWIGWVTVSDKADFLLRFCGSDSLIHCDNGRQSFAGVSEVIGGEYKIF